MKKFFYTSDTAYVNRNGQAVEILRPLTEKERGENNAREKFKVMFFDGLVIDAFEHELTDRRLNP